MVALYDKWIFKGKKRFWGDRTLEFLGEWEGTEKEFLETYHKLYPNEKLEIYKHKYKPLSRDLRGQIELYMITDPVFIQLNREEKLNNLLG